MSGISSGVCAQIAQQFNVCTCMKSFPNQLMSIKSVRLFVCLKFCLQLYFIIMCFRKISLTPARTPYLLFQFLLSLFNLSFGQFDKQCCVVRFCRDSSLPVSTEHLVPTPDTTKAAQRLPHESSFTVSCQRCPCFKNTFLWIDQRFIESKSYG